MANFLSNQSKSSFFPVDWVLEEYLRDRHTGEYLENIWNNFGIFGYLRDGQTCEFLFFEPQKGNMVES